jgi:hypothetical protein
VSFRPTTIGSPPPCRSEGDLVVKHDVVPDFSCFTDYDTGTMINEEAPPNGGPWMYLNSACQESSHLAYQAW